MNPTGQKADENVLSRRPGHFCVDGHFEGTTCFGDEAGFVLESVLDVCFALCVEEAESVDDCGCDEVVPGGHAEVAVKEEEDDEDQRHEEVGCFEELVVSVPMERVVSSMNQVDGDFSRKRGTAYLIQGMDMKVNQA